MIHIDIIHSKEKQTLSDLYKKVMVVNCNHVAIIISMQEAIVPFLLGLPCYYVVSVYQFIHCGFSLFLIS